jgi:chromosome partitioning protein
MIDLLPTNIDLAAAEISLPLMSNSDKRLTIELEKYSNYDYCLIDCPPSLGHLTKNALAAANLILIPVSTDLMALRTVKLIMNSVEDVKYSKLNLNLKVWHILPTRHKIPGNEAKQVFEELIGTYKNLVYLEPVLERESYKKAVRGQVDIASIDSKLGEYWLDLAKDLVRESEVMA